MAASLLMSPQGIRVYVLVRDVALSLASADTAAQSENRKKLVIEVVELTSRIAIALIAAQVMAYLNALNVILGLTYFLLQGYYLTPRVMALRTAPLYIEAINFTATCVTASVLSDALARLIIGVPWIALSWIMLSFDSPQENQHYPLEQKISDFSVKVGSKINEAIDFSLTLPALLLGND